MISGVHVAYGRLIYSDIDARSPRRVDTHPLSLWLATDRQPLQNPWAEHPLQLHLLRYLLPQGKADRNLTP